MKGLIQRAITALIFVLVMIGGLFGGVYSFLLLFAIITGLCLWEFLGHTLENENQFRDLCRKALGVLLGLSPFVLVSILHLGYIQSKTDFILITSLLTFPFIFGAFIFELFTKSTRPFANVAYIVLGMVYIGIPFAMLDFIAFQNGVFNANIIFGILSLTWMNDTGAYLIGSKVGKTPLFPRISPKKTWEGSMGGIFVGLLFGYLLSVFFNEELTTGQWLTLSIIVVIFGSLGDLIESMLKRSLNIKDSGSILPGHGGMLDRFDAFIFVVPFATAYLLWVQTT